MPPREDTAVEFSATDKPTPRIAALDGLRGLAILMVLVLHGGAPERPEWGAAYRFGYATLKSLWCGVDLFFVLSGFLITGILIDSKNKTHYFRNFFAHRFLRIFPIYYLALAVVMLMGGPFASVREDQAWFWTYTSNLLITLRGEWPPAAGHLWSLAIEEQFYILWPFVVWMCNPRKLTLVCSTLIIGALGLRIAMLWSGATTVSVYTFTPCRLDTLAIGGLIAIAMRDPSGRELLQRWTPKIFAATVLAIGGMIVATGRFNYADHVVATFGLTLIAVAFAGLVVFLAGPQPVAWFVRIFQARSLQWFGQISYGLYLYHSLLLTAIRSSEADVLFGEKSLQSMIIRTAVYYVSSILVAYLSFHLLEKPILSWKEKFVSKPMGTEAEFVREPRTREIAAEPLV